MLSMRTSNLRSFGTAGPKSMSRLPSTRLAQRVQTQSEFRASVDPMEASKAGAPFKFGDVYRVHTAKQVDDLVAEYKDNTMVVMCKSSHCKPCKAFMSTYYEMAERFPDTGFCDIIGDESAETRKTMMDWKVKATPTFFVYANGELVKTLAGKDKENLAEHIIETLKPEHRGRDWTPPDDSDEDDE